MTNKIPKEWQKFWQPVEEPPCWLIHFTSPLAAQQIHENGYIEPRDPTPRDWKGLKAVFMCDINDPSFSNRMNILLSEHFFKKSNTVDALIVIPDSSLYKCTLPERRSYIISLEKVSQIKQHYPYVSQAYPP